MGNQTTSAADSCQYYSARTEMKNLNTHKNCDDKSEILQNTNVKFKI